MMTSSFKTIGLIGRYRGNMYAETLQTLLHFLQERGLKVVLEQETAVLLNNLKLPAYTRASLSEYCDLIIVVGGDGSLLGAARYAVIHNIPVLGINRGSLGFLTDIKPEEVTLKVGEVLNGHYTEEARFFLQATVHHNDQILSQITALNDMVLLPGEIPHMIDFDIFINNQFVCNQRADGIIVATPTGSTAYALSGGGPILHPSLDAMVLVPVFPHKLSSRPIVVNGNSEIQINIGSNNESAPQFSGDSQERLAVPQGAYIRIQKLPQQLRLIHPIGYDYFETLRSKLGWETHKQDA